jgi:hypothetical protein
LKPPSQVKDETARFMAEGAPSFARAQGMRGVTLTSAWTREVSRLGASQLTSIAS